jgi:hypothetical protein
MVSRDFKNIECEAPKIISSRSIEDRLMLFTGLDDDDLKMPV